MASQPRLRALEIYQVLFNLFAISILVTRGASWHWLVVNVGFLAFILLLVPRLVALPDGRRHLGDIYFLPAFMLYYLETDILHTALYGDFLIDPWLMRADSVLVGGQPSIAFASTLTWPLLGETMSLAYSAFYPLVIVAGLSRLLRFTRDGDYERLVAVMAVTFVSCYALFAVLPSAGPRYTLAAGAEPIPGFVVSRFLEAVLLAGERPTGAFPSSHVAFAVIFGGWCWSTSRRLFWSMLPLAIALAMATVYIRAHYMIDALAGFAYGSLMLLISEPARRGLERKFCGFGTAPRKAFASPML